MRRRRQPPHPLTTLEVAYRALAAQEYRVPSHGGPATYIKNEKRKTREFKRMEKKGVNEEKEEIYEQLARLD